MKEIDFAKLREEMVIHQIANRGVSDPGVLQAFRSVPRHLFVPEEKRHLAYEDYPLPIGKEQTISQPYIVALMTESSGIQKGDKVLEIGTGSGYQAAILSYLGAQVYSIERIAFLAETAKELLVSLGYNANVMVGDGTLGWSKDAPYDKIIVTAAAPSIPLPWIEQLKLGGRIVVPLGGSFGQDLTLAIKVSPDNLKTSVICSCLFVPLIGKYGYK
jgi:protein-L-isoaspartate(D-aspartate) O-methyltransferase